MSSPFYVCEGSGKLIFESEERRAQEEYAAADATRDVRTAKRHALVSNSVASASPVDSALANVRAVESPASVLAPANAVATLEQARCADCGLGAAASACALHGAGRAKRRDVQCGTGRRSGVSQRKPDGGRNEVRLDAPYGHAGFRCTCWIRSTVRLCFLLAHQPLRSTTLLLACDAFAFPHHYQRGFEHTHEFYIGH